MLFLCLVTMLGLAMADPSRPCDSDCPPDWKSVEGDCVMFMYGWEEDMARQVCRGLKAEFSEFFISRSDSDSATRHSLPVCLLRSETQGREAACFCNDLYLIMNNNGLSLVASPIKCFYLTSS